ncbi:MULTISPECIES: hypothetical protein [Persicobacter]|uniref:Lipocalin-like domain-containing protein n=1 Tax=Persicobacter diffluens TaxID=981 RepID=A0AAN4VWY6_9BACT|nr:hypothetical protein [Persicobacter sp. CCB-QB2]GJM59840.1 hypothetical protein PEDI_03920 [Persicobacter diffluens]
MKNLHFLFIFLVIFAASCSDDDNGDTSVPSAAGDWYLSGINGEAVPAGTGGLISIPVEIDGDSLDLLLGDKDDRTVILDEDNKIYPKDISVAIGSWMQDNGNITITIDSLEQYSGTTDGTSVITLQVSDLIIELPDGSQFPEVNFRGDAIWSKP